MIGVINKCGCGKWPYLTRFDLSSLTALPDTRYGGGRFLADRTNGRAYATVSRLSVVCL